MYNMDTLVKLNSQTAGRDKIARVLQYLSRVLWHKLQDKDRKKSDQLKNLEYTLSSFRKLLRLGRSLDTLYSTLPILHYPNGTVRVTVALSKISTAFFLLADHILWLARANLCTADPDKWGRIANKYWLYSITLSLVRDFYEIRNIIKENKSRIVPSAGLRTINDCFRCTGKAIMVVQENRTVMIDTIKNACDFWIPLSALGHVKLSPGTTGLLGVVSSLAGMIVLIDPLMKMNPS